jgi:isopentenyl-diphosphate Delta-isomerase
MIIPIVNNQDKLINYIDIRNRDFTKHIYRVSALWITNSKGQILLQKRAPYKKQYPNKWSTAVAGTIEKGETYKSNIIKEAEEEIGLMNIKPKIWIKNNTLNFNYKHFTQFYTLTLDKPESFFHINKEVSRVKWFSLSEIKNLRDDDCDEILNSIKTNI